jgi:protein required for attachment to host cells
MRMGEDVDGFGAKLVVDGERSATKKRKGKKERMRDKAARGQDGVEMSVEGNNEAADSLQSSDKVPKRLLDDEDGVATGMSEPVKKRRRQKKSGKKAVAEVTE